MSENKEKKKRTKKPKFRKPKPRKKIFNSGLFKIVAIVVAIGCGVVIFATESDCANKQRELERLEVQVNEINLKNTELDQTLKGNDLSAYMERVALEERGYAYPDERRFYDTSRD